MTLHEWRLMAARAVGDADAAWIMEEALSLPRARLRLDGGRALSAGERAALDAALARRTGGEPVQYIFRRAPFMGYEFYVDERVLIPRMDTEILCEAAGQYIKGSRISGALDVCAGSGAIGISLARMFPHLAVTLSDISPGAGEVQRINAAGLGVEILTGDLFGPVSGRRFDLITINPPYVRADEIATLDPQVRREPLLALDGGADGLDFYRRIAREYRDYLNPGGRLYLEVGYDQAEAVRALLGGGETIRDLGGVMRVVWTEV